MEFQGKALYNLVRISWLEEPSTAVKPWQVEDLRELSQDELFARLAALDVNLSPERFLSFAEKIETSEELVELLWSNEEDEDGHDQAYLLLFELWRRLLPHRFALSIFCDELDWRIYFYDRDELGDELMQEAIIDLEDLLDTGVDLGGEPKEVFAYFESFCAHDLERFLYDYITEKIEQKEELEASKLVDEFYAYSAHPLWFDLLRARLLTSSDVREANLMFQRILEQLEEEPDYGLISEIASYLSQRGYPQLFALCIKILLPLTQTEEQFQELIELVAAHFHFINKKSHHKTARDLLLRRKDRAPHAPIDPTDLKTFSQLLSELAL